MYVYITSGTYEFLKEIKSKHQKENLLLMENFEKAVLLQETEGKKTVFASPRKFEVVDQRGALSEVGFVVLDNIPVREEERPGFEHRYKKRAETIENESGFLALRILRPLNSDTYVILTVWQNESSSSSWKNHFSSSADKSTNTWQDLNKNIFSGPPYVNQYKLGLRDRAD
ncbi:antibiotic biosynthesis monooxygenase [Peribacillus sp. FSL H8-0477]|uniref:antibiotic biosynthesis monooxygenase family protein n=1 Tax=Peribacillus sp. FSL H8-0477 TaxID=2921388 RepID=UPI0030F5B7C9